MTKPMAALKSNNARQHSITAMDKHDNMAERKDKYRSDSADESVSSQNSIVNERMRKTSIEDTLEMEKPKKKKMAKKEEKKKAPLKHNYDKQYEAKYKKEDRDFFVSNIKQERYVLENRYIIYTYTYIEQKYFDRDLRYRVIGKNYYDELQNTKEFQETQYYGIGYNKETKQLVRLNEFWCDYALHLLSDDTPQKNAKFVSQYFSLPTSCLSEMIFALAVLDLPLQTNDDNVRREKNFETMRMVIQSENPCIVLSKQLRETDQVSIRVQVSHHYFDPNDRYEIFDGEQTDKFVNSNNMIPCKMYGCRAIITNASSAQIRNAEVLYQIPAGAIPMNGGKWTHTKFETIPSYSSKIMEFYFISPILILGFSNNNDNNTVCISIPTKAVEINEDNWSDVSASGDVKTIVKYLEKHNLCETDLHKIYYLMSTSSGYTAVVDLLESKHHYENEIWRHSVVHQDVKRFGQYLYCNSNLLRHLFQPYFKSEWGYIYDDESLGNQQSTHLEYFPLINARTHKLGNQKKILNQDLLQTYNGYLRRICYLSVNIKDVKWLDLLKACYYLILQDRINESRFIFYELVEKEKGPLKEKHAVQYEYMKAYFCLLDEKDTTCETARKICEKYTALKTLPTNKQRVFEDMQRQLAEISGKVEDVKEGEADLEVKKEGEGNENGEEEEEDRDEDTLGERERRLERHAMHEPSIHFEIENRQLVFQYFKIDSVRVNFYRMDIELLFSMSPFLSRGQMDASQNVFSFIQPNESVDVKFPSNETSLPKSHSINIPESLLHCNIYCEAVVTNPSNFSSVDPLSQTFYDNRLLVQIKEKFGQLKVLDKETKKPLSKCYVKVYARVNGSPKFHKDGYTDRRGVFDYVSVSCSHLTSTDKFAILVNSKDRGAVVQTVNVPIS
ncbi:hypothetical protein RFI_15079 [Reticulomyxa filosa]|uniref:Uncharacterized protein n=1 Tax=Reticulomyxa filosa TaxID=46433 RepID=X6N8P1_RETFI|nr:hypothetical protein RFI_15079 [Reticulomyxa filosa]|eukprot:ETO22124.1 hypothetical protein RFI_15079 [Reticulomyxa filosa]